MSDKLFEAIMRCPHCDLCQKHSLQATAPRAAEGGGMSNLWTRIRGVVARISSPLSHDTIDIATGTKAGFMERADVERERAAFNDGCLYGWDHGYGRNETCTDGVAEATLRYPMPEVK